MFQQQKTKAFTLVELIVVITILAILGTITFISLQGYSQSARDSVRMSDMKNIEKGLELQLTKAGKVSIPENKIDITASGILIAYQGYAGKQVLNNIGVHGGGKDPIDEKYYTYMTNDNLTNYELLGYLENEVDISFVESTYAADLSTKNPRVLGNQLGILLQSGSLEPVQDSLINIDVVNTNDEYIAYLDNENVIRGTGRELKLSLYHVINKIGSCNTILKNGNSKGDGIYTIDPEQNGIGIDVYCDMKTDGGGWTKIGETEIIFDSTDNIISVNYLYGNYNSITEELDKYIDNSETKEWMTFHDNIIDDENDIFITGEFEKQSACSYQHHRPEIINKSSKYSIKQLSTIGRDEKYIKTDGKNICGWFNNHEGSGWKCHTGFSVDMEFNYFPDNECSVWGTTPFYCKVQYVNSVTSGCSSGNDVIRFNATANTVHNKILRGSSYIPLDVNYGGIISEYKSSSLYVR